MSDLVWAKIRYSPYWPAKVVETPPEIAPAPPNKICVLFFGTKQFGFIDAAKCRDYSQNRDELIKIGRGAGFREAVKQIDEYVANPIKFRSNAIVKPIGRKIKIKTEDGPEVALVTIKKPKVERNRSKINVDFQEEKQKLIKAYVDQKSENQKLTLMLKQKSEECQKLIVERTDIEREASHAAADLNNLKAEFSRTKCDYEQKITELQRQKQTLSAQNAQLQIALSQNAPESNDEDDNENSQNIFEVERILDDKMEGKEHYFCVRWKGFSSKYDTWERKANLVDCPVILKNYLKSKKMVP